jgi:hypothetical protein
LSNSTAFKKIQYFSKVSPQSLYTQSSIDSKYSKLSDLYLKSSGVTSSYNYGTLRQHNYNVVASNQYKQGFLDNKSVNTILDYNYGSARGYQPNFFNEHNLLLNNNSSINSTINNTLSATTNLNNLEVSYLVENPTTQNSQSATNDSKGHSNFLKYSLSNKVTKSNLNSSTLDLQTLQKSSLPHLLESESPRTFKYKDLKSTNLGFLSSEKNVRLIDEVNPSKFNPSMSTGVNNLDEVITSSIDESIIPNTYKVYSSSINN